MSKRSDGPEQVQADVRNQGGLLSFVDAAERILKEEGKPLRYREITKRASEKGLIQSQGKTPASTMYVAISNEIGRRTKRGEPNRFIFLGKGIFTLAEIASGIQTKKTQSAIEGVRDSRADVCEKIYKALTAKNQGDNFEKMVGDLLIKMGYANVEVIGGHDDKGVDILCEKRDGVIFTRIAVQCKCRSVKKEVGPKDVSTLRDNLSTYQCQSGIVITTSRLNGDAVAKAKEAGKDPIHFIEHDEILDLFAEYDIGVRSETVRYFQVDSSAYEFLK